MPGTALDKLQGRGAREDHGGGGGTHPPCGHDSANLLPAPRLIGPDHDAGVDGQLRASARRPFGDSAVTDLPDALFPELGGLTPREMRHRGSVPPGSASGRALCPPGPHWRKDLGPRTPGRGGIFFGFFSFQRRTGKCLVSSPPRQRKLSEDPADGGAHNLGKYKLKILINLSDRLDLSFEMFSYYFVGKLAEVQQEFRPPWTHAAGRPFSETRPKGATLRPVPLAAAARRLLQSWLDTVPSPLPSECVSTRPGLGPSRPAPRRESPERRPQTSSGAPALCWRILTPPRPPGAALHEPWAERVTGLHERGFPSAGGASPWERQAQAPSGRCCLRAVCLAPST